MLVINHTINSNLTIAMDTAVSAAFTCFDSPTRHLSSKVAGERVIRKNCVKSLEGELRFHFEVRL